MPQSRVSSFHDRVNDSLLILKKMKKTNNLAGNDLSGRSDGTWLSISKSHDKENGPCHMGIEGFPGQKACENVSHTESHISTAGLPSIPKPASHNIVSDSRLP